MSLGIDVARPLLNSPPPGPAKEPDAPGAFSLADRTRIEAVLSASGYVDIRIEALTPTLRVGATAREATRFLVEMGPVGNMLEEAEPSRTPVVETAMAERYQAFMHEGAIRVGAAAWIVTAVRPVDGPAAAS